MDPTTSLEHLLEQHTWVRRLARALVSDPDRADDLEQATWLSTLRSPPRAEGKGLRAFLRTVAQRESGREAGRATARRGWEERAAKSEALPDTQELVARAELERRAVEALLGLDPALRDTLLLRYFEDISPQEIAARSGTPVATVKTRLRRGLERLRDRLDAAVGGDRLAWAAVLARSAASSPATVTASKAVKLVFLGAAVVTLAVSALVLRREFTPEPSSKETSEVEVADAPSPDPTEPRAPQGVREPEPRPVSGAPTNGENVEAQTPAPSEVSDTEEPEVTVLRSVDEWRAALADLVAVQVKANYKAGDPWGAIHYASQPWVRVDRPAEVQALAEALAGSLRPRDDAMGLDWPSRFRLELADGRRLECCVAEGRLLMAGLRDSLATPTLKEVAAPWIAAAERAAAQASGTVSSSEELLEFPVESEVLTLYGITDEDFPRLARFSRLRELHLQFCRDSVHDEGIAALAALPALEVLGLRGSRGVTGRTLSVLRSLRELDLYDAESISPEGFAAIAELPSLAKLSLRATKHVDAEALRALAKSASLSDLDLSLQPTVPAEALAELGAFHALERLNLDRAKGLDAGSLTAISRLPRLQHLDLSDCGLDDAELHALSTATGMHSLELSFQEFTAAGLEALSGMSALRSLTLRRAGTFGDAGLAVIADLPALEELVVANCGASDAGFAALGRARALRRLDLSFSAAAGQTAAALAGLPLLQELELTGCKALTDEGLGKLGACPSLLHLRIRYCPELHPEAVAELRAALPECEIEAAS